MSSPVKWENRYIPFIGLGDLMYVKVPAHRKGTIKVWSILIIYILPLSVCTGCLYFMMSFTQAGTLRTGLVVMCRHAFLCTLNLAGWAKVAPLVFLRWVPPTVQPHSSWQKSLLKGLYSCSVCIKMNCYFSSQSCHHCPSVITSASSPYA